MPMRRERVMIPVEGIQLEGIMGYDSRRETGPGVIICHPHPQMGGSMENNVVLSLFDEFAEQGYTALAFNFRGVGRSGGFYEEGEGEIKDVLGALDWLKGHPLTGDWGVGLLGYSFGAWVGLRAAMNTDQIACSGAIAPPSGHYSFEFFAAYQGPFFFVYGDRDNFCSEAANKALMEGPEGKREAMVIRGADHFFWNHEKEAARFLSSRFQRWLPTS